MEEQNQAERFKKLIKKGFDIKDISLEFGIPLEDLKKWEQELLLEAQKQRQSRIVSRPSDNSASFLKMKAMRERYQELFSAESENSDGNKIQELSEGQLEEVKALIAAIEEKVQQLSTASKTQTREIGNSIIRDIRKLETYKPLPLEIAEKFKGMIDPINLNRILDRDHILNSLIYQAKKTASSRVVEALETMYQQAQSIEELQQINKRITPQLQKENRLLVDALKGNINKKISDLQLKRAMDKLKNIPPNIVLIVDGLANSELDFQEATRIIEEEAKRRVAQRPQSRFAVTEEQEKNQIALQIKKAIIENPDKYHIKNPEATIDQIQKLCGINQGEAIRTVVSNLIGRKHFETAKRICRKFSSIDDKGTLVMYIRRLQEDIRNAEISERVLIGINMKGTPEQQAAYYEAIETGLKMGNVNPRSVLLGKSKDGSRDITLADIWLPEEKDKKEK